ncbi:hypothetical protein [Seinonella peptonophila]|uniref:hypothetical protein n=1 Tax=Seinonella peptonophila TaxID=112248 RepID=UPI0011149C9B|nr:hypothetical protein [Seinonella peptonophila]
MSCMIFQTKFCQAIISSFIQLREVIFASKYKVQNLQQRNQLKKIAKQYGAKACKVSELQTLV